MSEPVQSYIHPASTPVGHSQASVKIHERPAWAINGWLGVLVVLACIGAVILLAYSSVKALVILPIVVGVVILASLTIVQPGQTRVVRFFGRYVGTVRRTGLSWILPLSDRRNVSIRVRNFETNHLKVNDADGNPVEIAAIVVWQVADTSRALYAVEDYLNFVRVQAESALRHVATTHPYDDPAGHGLSLRGSTDIVAGELAAEMAERVTIAGVEIVEVRISHLAYAAGDRPGHAAPPAGQRRRRGSLSHRRRCGRDGRGGARADCVSATSSTLDEERKAAMVSNLMVVLCSDQPASPVVNTGTLYS